MSYKFMMPGRPSRWADTNGLYHRNYTQYPGSSNTPDPSGLTSLGTTSGSNTTISSFSIGTTETFIWRGYFKPDQDSTSWEFRTTSDDGSFLWIDDNAEEEITSLNRSNAAVQNGGVHVSRTRTSSNLSLSSSFYYPIAIVAGNNTGPGSLTVEFRRDSGSWQSDGSGFYFYDSRYVDGFGLDS